jgi:CheY-like chemotaxis protein
MPIVDGLTSTKMIREKDESTLPLSSIAAKYGRTPVIAVSASLVERNKHLYIDAGFDGWILKPIDFRRLETLLAGAVEDEVRDKELYVPGEWERGGWFARRGESVPEPE